MAQTMVIHTVEVVMEVVIHMLEVLMVIRMAVVHHMDTAMEGMRICKVNFVTVVLQSPFYTWIIFLTTCDGVVDENVFLFERGCVYWPQK